MVHRFQLSLLTTKFLPLVSWTGWLVTYLLPNVSWNMSVLSDKCLCICSVHLLELNEYDPTAHQCSGVCDVMKKCQPIDLWVAQTAGPTSGGGKLKRGCSKLSDMQKQCVCVVRYIMDNAGENWICFHKEVEIVEQVEDWCCMCLLWVIYVCTVSIYTQHAPWWGLVWPLNVCLHANANRGCDFEGHMLYMDFRGLLACKCDVCKYKI